MCSSLPLEQVNNITIPKFPAAEYSDTAAVAQHESRELETGATLSLTPNCCPPKLCHEIDAYTAVQSFRLRPLIGHTCMCEPVSHTCLPTWVGVCHTNLYNWCSVKHQNQDKRTRTARRCYTCMIPKLLATPSCAEGHLTSEKYTVRTRDPLRWGVQPWFRRQSSHHGLESSLLALVMFLVRGICSGLSL